MSCHIIFDVKLEDLLCKARLVAGLHMTKPPPTITYARVVLQETVRTDLPLASLNDLPVKVSNLQNSYITAPVTEKYLQSWAVSLVKILSGKP